MSLLTNIIYYIVPFVVLLGILVFVHEFGHFIVARLLGVKVVAFSIGFGKKLWSRTDSKGTCWQLAAVPLGGYCQFLGDGDASSSTTDAELENLSEEEKSVAFSTQPAWKKILIVIAGPLFNYLLAVLLFIGIFWAYGKMVYPPVIGELLENGAAEQVGMKSGDRVLSINGNNVSDFTEISNEIQLVETDPITIKIERDLTAKIKPEICPVCGKQSKTKILGISTNEASKEDITAQGNTIKYSILSVKHILPNSPASKTDLQQNDILLFADEQPLSSFTDLKQYVTEHQDKDIEIKYRRNLTFNVNFADLQTEDTDDGMPKRRLLGITSVPELVISEEYNFLQAVTAGFKETYDLTAMTLRGVWQMLAGHRGGKDVGGIIRIAEISGDVSKHSGLIGFIYFMALISVNLGLINLFPIPVLDGGNLVIFLIELLIGRELKPNIKNYIFKFGIIIVLALMVLATWNDIVHLIDRIFK